MCKFLLASIIALLSFSSLADGLVSIDYAYSKNHGADFSASNRGTIKIAKFTDQREVAEALIANIVINDQAESFKAQQAFANIFQDAFIQAFKKGKASLVGEGEALKLSGEIVDVQGKISGEGAESLIELTVKLKISLYSAENNKKLWENILFSKARSLKEDNVDAAVAMAVSTVLDKLIEELMYDDYFLIEMGI